MKKFLKRCFIVTLVTLIFCSCSAKGVKLEQLNEKYFITKEKFFVIKEISDNKNSSDSKKYYLALYEKLKSGSTGYMIYENVKISKKDGKEYITADNLELDLEIINNKMIKDTKNNLEYKESEKKDIESNLELIK